MIEEESRTRIADQIPRIPPSVQVNGVSSLLDLEASEDEDFDDDEVDEEDFEGIDDDDLEDGDESD